MTPEQREGEADAVRTFDPEAPARAEERVRAALSKSWDCPCGEDRNIGPDCRACKEPHPYLALHPENRHLARATNITLTLRREEAEAIEYKLRESGEWKTRRHSPGYCIKGTQGHASGLEEVRIANKLRSALEGRDG